MAFQYQATLYYTIDSNNGVKSFTVPIVLFTVRGGANRTILLKSTNDISITSELEQARSYKNIIFGMPPSRGNGDMKATIDLTEAANKKMLIYIGFNIFKYSNGKPIEGFDMRSNNARIAESPQIGPRGNLGIRVSFSDVELRRMMYNEGKKPKGFEM